MPIPVSGRRRRVDRIHPITRRHAVWLPAKAAAKAAADKAAAEKAEKAAAAHLTGMYAEAMLASNEAARTMAALASDVLDQPDDRASSATTQDLQANPTSAEPYPLGPRVVGFRPPTHEDLAFAVDADFARTRHELESLIRIPSVSDSDFDTAELECSAQAVAGLLRSSGVSQVRLLEIEYAVEATTSATDGAVYCFRLTDAGNPASFTYTGYGQVTLS